MAKAFNIAEQTATVSEYAFAGRQAERARELNVERVFTWRDVQGNVRRLPQYVLHAISAAGYEAHCLGGTTYSHSVIGLSRV